MPEPIPHADDAAAYVLGTLGWRDRRRFEARLKKSPELRKVVRLLETGTIGLAMAAPHREPPIRLWAGIQTAVTHECEKQGRSASRKWLRNVAGIAACAVVGWFAYTSWNHRASTAGPTIVGVTDVAETQVADSTPPVLAHATSQASNMVSRPPRERRSLRPGENATLRERVGDLEHQVAHLAQTVTQQQVTPPDLNRLTFVNMVPEGSDATSPQIVPASPELRRALLLGVARQLGWMPPSSSQSSALPQPSHAPATQPYTQPADSNPPPPHNDAGVDFVDLPPPPVEAPAPETQTASVEKAQSTSATTSTPVSAVSEEGGSRSASSIPAFVSGTNLVFAVDSSVVPVGTETVAFYSNIGGGSWAFRGTINLGYSATVVTMPFLQARAWDNQGNQGVTSATAVPLQPGPGRIIFGSSFEGAAATFRFTLPDPSSTSP